MSKRKSAITKTNQGNSKERKARPALKPTGKAGKGVRAAKTGGMSKQDKVIGLLRQPEGTTIPVIIKKLGLILESDKPDGAEHRVYRVLDPKPAAAKSGAVAAGRKAA